VPITDNDLERKIKMVVDIGAVKNGLGE